MAESDKDACEPKEVSDGTNLNKSEGISRRSLFQWTSALTAATVLPSLFQPPLARAQAEPLSHTDFPTFLASHQIKHLTVKEYDHWYVTVRDAQVTLGDMVFYLKRPEVSFAGLQPAEALELPECAKWFEAAATRVFGAEKFQYIIAMLHPFVHVHALARYSHEKSFAGRTWTDKYWPSPAPMEDLKTVKAAEIEAILNAYKG